MRKTAPDSVEDRGQAPSLRGTNQTGMRQWNERLVLSLVRARRSLPKAEIARQTGLSAQTVSVIMRALEQDGLLERGEPVRGRVGQPSVPMSLAAEGAFFLGLKIGRRSSEMVLVDFHGKLRGRRIRRHDWPTPSAALTFADLAARELIDQLPPALHHRVAGLGVATPFRLWDWAGSLGAPQSEMDAWRDLDFRAALSARHPYPVFLENDATAACGAELIFGKAMQLPSDFVHVYVGFFVGGGVVLNGALYPGRHGNAGALGSMPVTDAAGRRVQLIDVASTSGLEAALVAAGRSADEIWATPDHWTIDEAILAPWIAQAAEGLAQATVAALSVFDFEALVLDGWMPRAVRQRMVAATRAALARQNFAGLEVPDVIEGTLGADARAMGAAALPLTDRFLVDRGTGALS
ncbi:ROK family transcriptional regulator [Pararhodobacter sp. CCB-MM2]|uniref:ROK family transcriptional regulator n=1 Tax=Pararhodobacter sp. CCB-MM2 TaxID=1786003 RepID=UPI0008330F3C|nr:ROK family transcriptional regulator [Pararhodobacter sp. CCB-MM2]